ncbi:hypothetical protein ABVK25_012386 [Lepraria finkii]|uniref:Uncharacterized protein n=1 Tax=Lepraria finkii TaxID=1340010 RepID=A0ABR4AM92_9LECA
MMGTYLLTGHANGAIVRWDVAKERMASEITNLFQPVTNIQMLRPDGFYDTKASRICGLRLFSSSQSWNSMLEEVPRLSEEDLRDNDLKAMTSNGWPDLMLDAAIWALDAGDVGLSAQPGDALTDAKAGRLEEEWRV